MILSELSWCNNADLIRATLNQFYTWRSFLHNESYSACANRRMLSFVALEGVLQDYLSFCLRPQQKTCETGSVDSFLPSRHRCYPALIIFPALILTFLSLWLLHIYDIKMPKRWSIPLNWIFSGFAQLNHVRIFLPFSAQCQWTPVCSNAHMAHINICSYMFDCIICV